jgi:fibronectin-binding autotransporter adhesin
MSQLNVDTIKNRLGTAGPVVPSLTVTNNATVGGALTVTGNETVSGNLTVTNNATVGGALTVTGNFTVNGTQTIINTQVLDVADKNIGIGSTSSPSDALADGAGITIYGDTNKTLLYDNTRKGWDFNIPLTTDEVRFYNVAEKLTRIDGNTVNLVYSANGSNIGLATNPSGNITLNVTGIPTDSSFDNHVITFSVFVTNTGTARSCTAVTLNGVTPTIKFAGGSLAAAISGVTTTSGFDIYSFTGINTVGSASTTANYAVLGVVNGGFR